MPFRAARHVALLILCILTARADAGESLARPAFDAVVRDESGNVYVAGTFSHAAASVGGIVMTKSPASGADLFVAMLGPDGAGAWAANFGSARAAVRPAARAIARGGGGAIFIAGRYAGGSFDDLRLAATATETGFVMRFDPRAGVVWATAIDGGHADIGDLALDPAEDAVFLSGAVEAGGQPAARQPRRRYADAVLARLDPATGVMRWLRRVSGAGGNPPGQAIVLDGVNRRLYLAGDAASANLPPDIRPDPDGRFVLAIGYDGGPLDIRDAEN